MSQKLPDPTRKPVIILTGEFAGEEGVCLGPTSDGKGWAVSPGRSDRILSLQFDRDFGILMNKGQAPGNN
jgi:hypothetical protein